VPCGNHEHNQWILWATNGTSYRIQLPYRGAEGWESDRDGIDWMVEVSGPVKLPAHVAGVERCPALAEYWPRPVDGTRIGRIREKLTTTFGPGCACCRKAIAVAVDLHVSGCAFAEYLHEPPARDLDLIYPRTPTAREKVRLRRVRELADAPPELAETG
jgi:hypothetical protein